MASKDTKSIAHTRILHINNNSVNGPTEKISAFVDKLLKPIAQSKKSYTKDTPTSSILEQAKCSNQTLVAMVCIGVSK